MTMRYLTSAHHNTASEVEDSRLSALNHCVINYSGIIFIHMILVQNIFCVITDHIKVDLSLLGNI